MSQLALAQLLRLEKSTTSQLASGLEERGIIQRARDAGDSRIVRLRLTRTGVELAERLRAARQERLQAVFAALPAGERADVLRALARLAEAASASQRR